MQHRGRRIPARAVHVAPRVEGIASVFEYVAVVVAGVRGAGAGPVVAAGEEDVPLCGRTTCELQKMSVSVMLWSVMWPPPESGGRIPDVVDEVAGLLAGARRAVAQYAAVGRECRMHRDERPVEDGGQHPVEVRLRGRRQSEGAGGGDFRRQQQRAEARLSCVHWEPCDVCFWCSARSTAPSDAAPPGTSFHLPARTEPRSNKSLDQRVTDPT